MKKLFSLLTMLLPLMTAAQLILIGPDGTKTELKPGTYTMIVPQTVDPPKPPDPNLPNCGCESADFPVSVKPADGTKYLVSFNSCNVSPLAWKVTNGNVQYAAGGFVPTSGTFVIDMGNAPKGTYTMTITSTGCNGKGVTTFEVAGGVSPPPVGCTVQDGGLESIWLGGLDEIVQVGGVLIGGNKKKAIDNWFRDGGNAVQITAAWSEMELAEGLFATDPKNKLIAVLNYLRDRNMTLYIKLHMSISGLSCTNGNCPSHLYNIYQDGMRTRSGAPSGGNGGDTPMTLSSAKIANMQRFWRMMAELLAPYKQRVLITVTNEGNQELQYVIEPSHRSDYHPEEEAAFKAFQQAVYGNVIGNQPDGFNDAIGKRWMRFKGDQLIKFTGKWGPIFTAAGFKTVYDTGSFVDQLLARGVLTVPTDALKSSVTALKENPAWDGSYNIELIGGLSYSYNRELSVMETTFNPNTPVEWNIDRMSREVQRARTAGVKVINYSFVTNYWDESSPNFKAVQGTLQRLKNNGWLARSRVCTDFCPEFTMKASGAIDNGGYQARYSGEYNAVLQGCPSDKGAPPVRVLNDL